MKLTNRLFAALVLAHLVTAAAPAAELTGYAVLTTDYVWRGVTQSDGHAALQLGGDLRFTSGFYAGAWASTIDIEDGAGYTRDVELDLYAGYLHELGADWTLGATVVAYTYPGQEGPFDYDYEELAVSANFRDRAWVELAWSPDLYDSGYETWNLDVYSEWPVGRQLLLGAGAGYYDLSDWFDDGYAYWQLGLTWPIGRFDLDLRYHDTDDWVPVVSSDDRSGSRVVLSVRLTF